MKNWTRFAAVTACVLVAVVQGCDSRSVGFNQATLTGIQLSQFVLYAQQGLTLGTNDIVVGGDVGVASLGPSTFGPQIVVGAKTTVDQAHTLYAPSVSLSAGAAVGKIDATNLTNSGGKYTSLSPFPSGMPTLPLGQISPGGANVTVNANATLTINPGAFGQVSIGQSGTLILSSGAYSFTNVTLANSGSLVANAGTSVGISGSLTTGTSATLRSSSGLARDLVITVSGNDATSPFAPVASINGSLRGLLSVPHGTLSLAANFVAVGAMSAFDITVGDHARITYQTGLSVPVGPPTQTIPSNAVPSMEASSPILSPVPQNVTISVGLELPLQNLSTLTSLFQALYDPTNPSYRHFLTPAAFNAQFSSTTAYSALVSWAQAQGLTTTTFANNRLLAVAGPVSRLESVFAVSFNYYGYPPASTAGTPIPTQYFAPDRPPTMPTWAPALFYGAGFNSFNTPVGSPPTKALSSVTPNAGSGPNGTFYGSDFRFIYAGGTSLTGAGQTIAIASLGQDFQDSDIQGYLTLNHTLPPFSTVTPQRIQVLSGALNNFNNGLDEATLDVETALAMAPGANVQVFEGPSNGVFGTLASGDLIAQAVFGMIAVPSTNQSCQETSQCPAGQTCSQGFCLMPVANQVSCSFLGFDGIAVTQSLVQMAVDGQSVFIASRQRSLHNDQSNFSFLRLGLQAMAPA